MYLTVQREDFVRESRHTVSLFERLIALIERGGTDSTVPYAKHIFLCRQYRMHPEICELANDMVYNHKLVPDESVFRRESIWLVFFLTVCGIGRNANTA